MAGHHTVIVLNPDSGGGTLTQEVFELGTRPGYEIWPVEPGEDPRQLAAKARREGAERVVAAGGDGTVNAVANGLLAEDKGELPDFAVLPCGSANDFTKALGIGPDFKQALAALEAGWTRRLDVVKVTGGKVDVLVNAATGGLSVEINEEMDADTKRWWGGYAYAITAVEVVPAAKNYHAHIETDEGPLAEEMAAAILCNGTHAGGVALMPPADPSDGLLDLAAVLSTTLAERARMLTEFAVGGHLESDLVAYRQVRWVRIESDPPMPFIGDGELLGETPLKFEVVPNAMRIAVVPPEDL